MKEFKHTSGTQRKFMLDFLWIKRPFTREQFWWYDQWEYSKYDRNVDYLKRLGNDKGKVGKMKGAMYCKIIREENFKVTRNEFELLL